MTSNTLEALILIVILTAVALLLGQGMKSQLTKVMQSTSQKIVKAGL